MRKTCSPAMGKVKGTGVPTRDLGFRAFPTLCQAKTSDKTASGNVHISEQKCFFSESGIKSNRNNTVVPPSLLGEHKRQDPRAVPETMESIQPYI